jgi:hypothetical protein
LSNTSSQLQAQRRRQRGELVRDGRGLLGRHPPHHVIVSGVRERVLGRELGLSDAAHPVQRVHRDRRAARQATRQPAQLGVPPGEVRVVRRRIPHPGGTPGNRGPPRGPPLIRGNRAWTVALLYSHRE